MRAFRGIAIACGLGLLAWVGIIHGVHGAAMAIGENWLGSAHTPTQDLAAYGGSLYSTYFQSPMQDGDPQRMRLIRYRNAQPRTVLCEGVPSPYLDVWGAAYCPSQVQATVAAMQTRGLWWALGNEVNLGGQDGGLTNDADGRDYARWYHDITGAIRAGDPTAKILGSFSGLVEHWLDAGRVAYDRLRTQHQQLYGTPPFMTAVNLHYYPQSLGINDQSEGALAGEINQVVDYAQGMGVGLAVTEWSYWAQNFDTICTPTTASYYARYYYTLHGLQAMAQRGVLFALWFGNGPQSCDDYGHAAWLFNPNGTMTIEGIAHRNFALGASPACLPSFIRRCK